MKDIIPPEAIFVDRLVGEAKLEVQRRSTSIQVHRTFCAVAAAAQKVGVTAGVRLNEDAPHIISLLLEAGSRKLELKAIISSGKLTVYQYGEVVFDHGLNEALKRLAEDVAKGLPNPVLEQVAS